MHGAYIDTLGLMKCQKYVSLASADPHDSGELREKIESWENS